MKTIKLNDLYAAAKFRPDGYIQDVLSHSVVNEAEGTYTISDEAWNELAKKYRGAVAQSVDDYMKINGPKLWRALHSWAMTVLIITPEILTTLEKFALMIPCGTCQDDWKEQLKTLPAAEDLFAWTVDVHNNVNRKLGKPELPLDKARDLYKDLPQPVTVRVVRKIRQQGNFIEPQ